MRIRGTKPEFWRSERIASVDWDARLVLKGLESYVDDNGVGKDDLALIVGDLFQRDLVREPSRTLARVTEAISTLTEAGLLWRYEADGTKLLFVSFWESVQRVDKPQAGRFPRPDGTFNYKDSIIRESSRALANVPAVLAPVTGEQGNRGTGEQRNRGTDTARKRATRLSSSWQPDLDLRAWAATEAPHVNPVTETQRFIDYWIAQPGQKGVKVDWPATWRNWMRRNEDDLANRNSRKPTRTEENLAVVAQYAAMESQQGAINA